MLRVPRADLIPRPGSLEAQGGERSANHGGPPQAVPWQLLWPACTFAAATAIALAGLSLLGIIEGAADSAAAGYTALHIPGNHCLPGALFLSSGGGERSRCD